MSLDILKERFSGKPITSQYEDKIESKQKTIDKLELEAENLSNQVLNLEKEKNFLFFEKSALKSRFLQTVTGSGGLQVVPVWSAAQA